MPLTLCQLLEETGLVLALEAPVIDGGTRNLISHAPPCTRLLKKPLLSKKSTPTTRQPVFVVDSDTLSIHSKPEESTWDDERGITTLRKYYALRDEAENVVVESKRTWLDTPFHFSLYKVRVCFLLPLSFIYYLHQLSKHQEARPGCKLF